MKKKKKITHKIFPSEKAIIEKQKLFFFLKIEIFSSEFKNININVLLVY